MTADTDPTPAPRSSSARHVSLVRCPVCGRADECSAMDVTAHMRAGGAVCCGRVMDLFIQVAWPGQPSAVVKVPAARTPPSRPTPPPTAAWEPKAGTSAQERT